ncbi:MAG: hypothetical protein HY320_02485 [Armatimonadetes bacterium]|nr:hypothetical protein [Armatimonadota bacterium]
MTRRDTSHRWIRFDPVTVRAGARLICLAQRGRLHPRELRFYLEELARMERHQRSGAGVALFRIAQRRARITINGERPPLFLDRRSAGELHHRMEQAEARFIRRFIRVAVRARS